MYLELAKQLPKPTNEQIDNYVQNVASAHSWHKHLPSDRTIPFVFYLDPNSNRKLVSIEEDGIFSKKIKFKFKEIKADNNFVQEYTNKYGYWQYNLLADCVSINVSSMKELFRHDPNRYIGLHIIDKDRFSQPLSFSDLKDILYPLPNELIKEFTFNMSRYLHPAFKDVDDYFDDKYPEKSYAQMHRDIISDFTEHLKSIVNSIYSI